MDLLITPNKTTIIIIPIIQIILVKLLLKISYILFLHIARKFQPEKIYFYMSQEICELDDLDNRYEKSIKLLNQHLNILSF